MGKDQSADKGTCQRFLHSAVTVNFTRVKRRPSILHAGTPLFFLVLSGCYDFDFFAAECHTEFEDGQDALGGHVRIVFFVLDLL